MNNTHAYGSVHAATVPPESRALSTLPRVDYADAFIFDAGPDANRTAEQWARATLEGAPAAVRRSLRRGWLALGLKLASPRSRGTVLGWEVRRSTPDVALLGADSRFGLAAELLFRREGETVHFSTFVHLKNPVARAVWSRVEPVHEQVVPRLLAMAERRPADSDDHERNGAPEMRLPNTEHTSRPWRIHELTPDFRLEDVWALPTPGGPDDLPRLVKLFATGDPSQEWSGAARTLWAIRWKVGDLLGLDGPGSGVGSRVPTLRERLPSDLRDAPPGPDFDSLPFRSVYLLDDEWAAEIANRTVHGVLHVGWVPDEAGGYRGQMAVLVKPNGLLGAAYMAAIKPFRYLIVYPRLLGELERDWRAGPGGPTPVHA